MSEGPVGLATAGAHHELQPAELLQMAVPTAALELGAELLEQFSG